VKRVIFLAKVNVSETNNINRFAGIDSGFNHLIRPMFYGSQHKSKTSHAKGKSVFTHVVDTFVKRTFATIEKSVRLKG
jgi:diaminopimelate decarboxylase